MYKRQDVEDGAFGENLLVSGIEFTSYPVGTQFKIGDVLLEPVSYTHLDVYKRQV